MKIVVLIFLVLCISACSTVSPTLTQHIDAGKIVHAKVIPTSFNEMIKTEVETEKLFIVVYGTPTIEIGKQSYVSKYSNGNCWFRWEGATEAIRCSGD